MRSAKLNVPGAVGGRPATSIVGRAKTLRSVPSQRGEKESWGGSSPAVGAPRTAISTGTGTVADYVSEAKSAVLEFIVFLEDAMKMDQAAWDRLDVGGVVGTAEQPEE